MSEFFTYLHRDSVVHRLPAGSKVAGVAVTSIVVVTVNEVWAALSLLGLTALAYVIAQIPVRVMAKQMRLLCPLAVLLGAYQVVVNGVAAAVTVVGGLVGLVLLAGLVSLSTRTTALVDFAVRAAQPFKVVGVNPERLGLALALGIRSVPVVIGLAREVREAQVARGAGINLRAFAVPLVVRSLRHADELAEALVARGFDD